MGTKLTRRVKGFEPGLKVLLSDRLSPRVPAAAGTPDKGVAAQNEQFFLVAERKKENVLS